MGGDEVEVGGGGDGAAGGAAAEVEVGAWSPTSGSEELVAAAVAVESVAAVEVEAAAEVGSAGATAAAGQSGPVADVAAAPLTPSTALF